MEQLGGRGASKQVGGKHKQKAMVPLLRGPCFGGAALWSKNAAKSKGLLSSELVIMGGEVEAGLLRGVVPWAVSGAQGFFRLPR